MSIEKWSPERKRLFDRLQNNMALILQSDQLNEKFPCYVHTFEEGTLLERCKKRILKVVGKEGMKLIRDWPDGRIINTGRGIAVEENKEFDLQLKWNKEDENNKKVREMKWEKPDENEKILNKKTLNIL